MLGGRMLTRDHIPFLHVDLRCSSAGSESQTVYRPRFNVFYPR